MKLATIAMAFFFSGFALQAVAQAPTEKTIQTCRDVTRKMAGTIAAAQRNKIDPSSAIIREADHWGQGIINYMLHAATTAPHLSEHEIATIGYSYCIERRPSGT